MTLPVSSLPTQWHLARPQCHQLCLRPKHVHHPEKRPPRSFFQPLAAAGPGSVPQRSLLRLFHMDGGAHVVASRLPLARHDVFEVCRAVACASTSGVPLCGRTVGGPPLSTARRLRATWVGPPSQLLRTALPWARCGRPVHTSLGCAQRIGIAGSWGCTYV